MTDDDLVAADEGSEGSSNSATSSNNDPTYAHAQFTLKAIHYELDLTGTESMKLDLVMQKAIMKTVGVLDALKGLNVAGTENILESISRRVKKKLTFLE